MGVGGVIELLALCVLAVAVLAPPAEAEPTAPHRGGAVAYLAGVAGLAASVLIGMCLGEALPV